MTLWIDKPQSNSWCKKSEEKIYSSNFQGVIIVYIYMSKNSIVMCYIKLNCIHKKIQPLTKMNSKDDYWKGLEILKWFSKVKDFSM